MRDVGLSMRFFWPVPRSQLYAGPQRLEQLGRVESSQEPGGRMRRTFTITKPGRSALIEWLRQAPEAGERRAPAMLRLFTDAAPELIAPLATRRVSELERRSRSWNNPNWAVLSRVTAESWTGDAQPLGPTLLSGSRSQRTSHDRDPPAAGSPALAGLRQQRLHPLPAALVPAILGHNGANWALVVVATVTGSAPDSTWPAAAGMTALALVAIAVTRGRLTASVGELVGDDVGALGDGSQRVHR